MQKYLEDLEIVEQRSYQIVKANEIIQKARNQLGLLQLKILAYILSKVKPSDKAGKYYTFSIKDFCKVCDIENENGKNYRNVKDAIKSLHDKSFWVENEDGDEVLYRWIDKPTISHKSGNIKVRLDEDIQKYIIALYERYTQYSLWEVTSMKSRYSFVLFEFLKSHAFKKRPSYKFDIEEIKQIIGATKYVNFKDFRINVLEIATREINQFTTLKMRWEPIKKGRKVVEIEFYIQDKTESELFKSLEAEKQTTGQINLYEISQSTNIINNKELFINGN